MARTVCEKIMGSLNLPLDFSKEHKMAIWCNVLEPQMTKMLGIIKNNITQARGSSSTTS
jgi:hypothetical protein